MIKSLKYEVTFPKTGRTFKGDLSFSEGLTAITGRNEAGKSLSLEFIRFALFGTKALRGKAEDYKTLSLSLDFELRGKGYRVVRKGSKADLFSGDEQLATGTKPVNDAIVRLFGYGLDVFDMANNCSQGEIERLGSMKPTERKALVDKTIGLDAIDRAARRVNDELADARTRVETLEENLVEPVAPIAPENYQLSDELRGRLESARSAHDAAVASRAWLEARADRVCPVRPEDPCPAESLHDLRERDEQRRESLSRVGEINHKLSQLREPQLSLEQIATERSLIEQHKAWSADQLLRNENPEPRFSDEVLGHIERAQEAQVKRAQIERLQEDMIECPSCGHNWFEAEDAIEQIREGVPLYDDDLLPEGWETVSVQAERRRAERWASLKLSGAKRPEKEPSYTAGQLDTEERLHREIRASGPLQKEAKALLTDLPEDKSAELQAKEDYTRALSRYEEDKAKWDAYLVEKERFEKQLAEAQAHPDLLQIDQLSVALESAITYEANLKHYEAARAVFDEQTERLEARREERDQWMAARGTLRTLKTSIKTHLIPSLNTVASVLISQMTGGERNKILIDEDFEISVDGQSLNTLSGSGKAVANLAIRLGLGQVLTNKTFSVFMADEIDGSMDQDRAGFTAECLSALAGSISQILLVTHKNINAPNTIEIGASYEKPDADASGAGDGNERAA